MSNNIRILFYLANHKKNNKGQSCLMLRITYSNNIKQISTGFYIHTTSWNKRLKEAKKEAENAEQINKYIATTKAKLFGIYVKQLAEGDIDLNKLFDAFTGKISKRISLLQAIDFHNNNFKSRIGIDYTFSTFQKYEITCKKIKAFLLHEGKEDVNLNKLNREFISGFEYYLKSIEKNQHNTAIKYCKNLKKILNLCVANEWIGKNPFEGYICSYKDTDQVFLLEHELRLIESKTFKNKRLQLVRDLFLFQCYTGLAYSDMSSLTKSDITIGIDGGKWIIKRRQKTGIKYLIPLLDDALKILSKYEDFNSNLFPTYSIQKFNTYLDEIADVTGLEKKISSHVGRRTFGNLALSRGISLNVISKMMGHSSTITTQKIYAITQEQLISKEMEKFKNETG